MAIEKRKKFKLSKQADRAYKINTLIMGGSLSSQTKTNTKLKKSVDEQYFLPRNLFVFFEQFTRKQMKPNKSDSKVEPLLFTIIIDQILLQQNNPGHLQLKENLESRIFDAIRYQISSFISQANPFADRFRFIEDNMQNQIQAEIMKAEADWTQNAKSLIFDMNSSNQTPTILNAAFSVFFQVANISNFEKLSVSSVDHLLEQLNKLVKSQDCPDLSGTSPQLISKFNSFIVNLALSPKFATNQIKSKVITFLLHISKIQGGIYTVLAALTVGMSVQALTPFDEKTPALHINNSSPIDNFEHESLFGSSFIISIPHQQLYSACAVTKNNNLILVTSKGLVKVNQQGRILQTREVKNVADLLITCSPNQIFTLNKVEKKIFVYNYSDSSFEFDFNFEFPLETKIEPNGKIVGITFCTYLFVLVETGFYECYLYGFEIDKKSLELRITDNIKLSYTPRFIYPGNGSVYLHCDDILLRCKVPSPSKRAKPLKLFYTPNRVINEENAIVTSSNKIAFVLKSGDSGITVTQYQIKYGNVIPFLDFSKQIASSNPSTFNSFLVDTIANIRCHLYQAVQYVFQKVSSNSVNLLQYFAASPKETISFALSLGQQSLNSSIFPCDTRQQILYFSLIVLTINGRCYISQFPLNQFEIEESDSVLLNQIKTFVETVVFHSIATPEIIAAAFQTIKATFRFLYFPDYGKFRLFLNGFKSDPRLLAISLPFLIGSSALFYALDTELISLISPYLTDNNLHYIVKDRICDINNELHFLKVNNITMHEQYIANFISSLINYYTDKICFSELFSRMQKSVMMILRIFTRVLVLDSAPIVSVSFAESCLRLLKAVKQNFTPSSKDISNDLEYSTVPYANETTQRKIENVETQHPYEDGKDLEWKIEMNGASEIEIEFDQRCATERNTDYLQIYDRADGGSLFGKNYSGPSSNWPRKIVVPSDSIRLFFHADESTNDWGFQCTISANVPVSTREFKPDICLSMINLICYGIGRSLQQALISLPIVELEKEYKIMFESNILKGSSDIINEETLEQMTKQAKFLIHDENSTPDSLQRTRLPIDHSKARFPNRSKSERAFDDISSQDPVGHSNFRAENTSAIIYDESRQLSLINDLTAYKLDEGTPAHLFLQMLYRSNHKPTSKQTLVSSIVERFAFAALIRQLGMVSLCAQTAMELVQSTANPSGPAKPPIHMKMAKLVKTVLKLRTSLHSAFQKSKVENRNINSLRENYYQYAIEMVIKSKYLLLSDPLIKVKENSSDLTFESALDLLSSFISSDIRFIDIKKMVDIRVKRAETRIKAMSILSEFVQMPDMFNTSRISFLSPLINSFPSVVDKTNIKSISLLLMNNYDEHCSYIHKQIIDTIASERIPNALRLFLLRFLLFPTQLMTNEENNMKSLLNFLSSFSANTIDEIAFSEGLWLFLSNIAIHNRSEDVCKSLLELALTIKNEYFKTKIITLQSIMVIDGFYKDVDLQMYFDLMNDATPRLIGSILRFISLHFYNYGVNYNKFSIIYCGKRVNFSQLTKLMLQFIAKAQIYETLPNLPKSLSIESHQYVSNEIVSYFRQLISQKSRTHQIIEKEFQQILTAISEVTTIESLFEKRELTLEFLALLIIFGNGMQPILQGSYGVIISGPCKDDIMKITAYSSLADIVTGIQLTKSFTPNSISPNTISPTSRVQPNPRNFEFLENHFIFFQKFHEYCQQILKSNSIHREHRLLSATISAFYCFIPMALQNLSAMHLFLKTSNLKSWLDFSIEKSNETTLSSISELSLAINDRIEILSSHENDKELQQLNQNEPQTFKYQQTPEYSFDSFSDSYSAKTHLQFSILPSNERDFSPSKMVLLFGNGEVDHSKMTASTDSTAVFVGDRTIPNKKQFYWEAKILSTSHIKFAIGFIDSRESNKSYEIFALSLPAKEIISPTIGSVKLDEPICTVYGDIFGIALARGQILFYKNGNRILRTIPAPHLGNFTPFISVMGTGLNFEYNFGQNHFKTEFTREQIFDFCGECFIGINLKYHFETTSFRSNFIEDESYLNTLKKCVSVLENARGSDEEIKNNSNYKKQIQKEKDNFDSEHPLAFILKSNALGSNQGALANSPTKPSGSNSGSAIPPNSASSQPLNALGSNGSNSAHQNISNSPINQCLFANTFNQSNSLNLMRTAKGLPILVQRIHLTPKEVSPNEHILFSTTMKEKLGQIGIVRELIEKPNSYIALLDFCDPGIGTTESLKFDSRYLSYLPIRKNPNTTFGQTPLIIPEKLYRNAGSMSSFHSLLTPILTELNALIRALSMRMARFSMLILLDFLRTKPHIQISESNSTSSLASSNVNLSANSSSSNLSTSVNSNQVQSTLSQSSSIANFAFENFDEKSIVSLLSILILELTNFSPSIIIKSKWSHVHISDSIFSDSNSCPILVVDPSKMSKVLRMVLLSIYQDKTKSKLLKSIFQIALDTFQSPFDSADNLFMEAPPELRIESTHPCSKVSIMHTVNDPNAVGFVPIVTSNCQLPGNGITVSNIQITGQNDDIRFIDGQRCEISGEISHSTLFKGVALALLPIHHRLCDSTLKTSKGAAHLTFSLLSLIFSFNLVFQNEEICAYMKNNLFLSFLTILKDGGVLGSVFAFEFIAPLLSHLEWNSNDLTESTLNLIHEYLKKFEDSVTDWKKLSVAAQHATLLKMLFDLTNIDASTMSIFNAPIENTKECWKNLSFFYHTLDNKLHLKPLCKFHEIVNAFTLVAALAHNWSFPIKFPSFLLLDSFLSSIQGDPSIIITNYDEFEECSFDSKSMQRTISMKYAASYTVDSHNIDIVITKNSNENEANISNAESTGKADNLQELANGQANNDNIKNQNHEIKVAKGASGKVGWPSFKLIIPKDIKDFKIEIHIQSITPEGREFLFITHFESFRSQCEFMEKKWNQKIDETLLKIMNQSPQLSNDNSRFKLSHTQLISNSVLQDVPPSLLTTRVELIKQLNSSVTQLLKCVDLGDNQVLSAAVIAAKSAIATSYKLDLFRRKVMNHLDEDSRLNLRFNRSRAALHMMNPTHPDAMPLLKQLIDQVPERALKSLKRDSVPWHVDLLGEGATDAGGPARDIFTQTCLEIMHPSTGLFVMTPNKRAIDGPNQELLIPNSHATSPVQQQMFIYSGVLMTIAFISRLPQPFKFAEFVWAHFTGAQMTIEDIYSIDKPFETLMKQIDRGEMDEAELERRGLTFTVYDTHGDSIELFPGGGGVRVTVERLPEYAQMCKKFRIREMKQQLDWLKEGISYFFPPDALFLLSPWELELIVCGDNSVSVSELKKHCRFDSKDKSSKMLWQVLESFSSEERMLFIKFATGRMGLPPPGSKWHSDLTISWVQTNVRDDAAMPLPTAATCSSTIRIPRYSTEEWMAKKIRAAIVFGVDIDTDRQVNFSDIVQLS